MKRTPAHKGAGTDELPRTRASFRVSFSNAEPNELYSRSRDFSIVLDDDLAELLVEGDRVAELVGQLAVVVDREQPARRCGGVRKRAVHAVSGGSGGLPPTRPAKPHPEGTSTTLRGGGCGGRRESSQDATECDIRLGHFLESELNRRSSKSGGRV